LAEKIHALTGRQINKENASLTLCSKDTLFCSTCHKEYWMSAYCCSSPG
jgi:hypothetical protein